MPENGINILVVGRNPEILETILRLLNGRPGWNAVGAMTDEDALLRFSNQPCEIVLFGGGVEASSEEKLTLEFQKRSPAPKIIRHYGGGSGLLFGEIYQALEMFKR
jgi:hypothetical protein